MELFNINYNIFIILLFVNIVLFKFTSYFFVKSKIVDRPDKKLKIHKKIVPYNGGTVYLINCLLILFYLNYDNFIELDEKIFSLFLIFFIIFLIGFIDDVFNLSPTLRFLILFFVIFFLIKNFDYLNLEIIKFNSIEVEFQINSAGILFTIFCLLSFIQASNMIDGINLQFGIYNIFLILYLNTFVINFSIYLIPILIIFLYFNFKNQSFFGDSGSYFSSFLMGVCFIYYYNTSSLIFADDIFIAMLIPGLDMIRLFFSRINMRKSPFAGDRNHLHHLFLVKYDEKISILSSSLVMTSPMILKLFINNNVFISLFCIISYSAIIIFLKSSD